MNRRLGVRGVLALLACFAAVLAGVTLLLREDPAAETPAAPVASACGDPSNPYGTPPDNFTYEPAEEAARAKAVESLDLSESGGRVEMTLVRRTELTLGSIIGVPSDDPEAYADEIVTRAEKGGAGVTHAKGYALIPLSSGTGVAVGVRGCRTVLITAQDPAAVQYLATVVLTEQ